MAVMIGPIIYSLFKAMITSNATYGMLETRNVRAYARLRLNTCEKQSVNI